MATVVAAAGLAACGSGSTGNVSVPTTSNAEPLVQVVGDPAHTVYLKDNAPAAVVVVEQTYRAGYCFNAPGVGEQQPTNGMFVIAKVKVTDDSTSATHSVNPSDWYYLSADSTHWNVDGDNANQCDTNGELSVTTLNPGESASGIIAFDVPASTGKVVYAPAGTAVAEWTVDSPPVNLYDDFNQADNNPTPTTTG